MCSRVTCNASASFMSPHCILRICSHVPPARKLSTRLVRVTQMMIDVISRHSVSLGSVCVRR